MTIPIRTLVHDSKLVQITIGDLSEIVSQLDQSKVELQEMTRRRDAWKKKARGYDELTAAVRAGIEEAGTQNLSRIFLRGALVDSEDQLMRAQAALEGSKRETILKASKTCSDLLDTSSAPQAVQDCVDAVLALIDDLETEETHKASGPEDIVETLISDGHTEAAALIEQLQLDLDEARSGNHTDSEFEPTWNELVDVWKARSKHLEDFVDMLICLKPCEKQLHSAALSYRHDHGLLPEDEQERVSNAGRYWLEAWQKEFFDMKKTLSFTPSYQEKNHG